MMGIAETITQNSFQIASMLIGVGLLLDWLVAIALLYAERRHLPDSLLPRGLHWLIGGPRLINRLLEARFDPDSRDDPLLNAALERMGDRWWLSIIAGILGINAVIGSLIGVIVILEIISMYGDRIGPALLAGSLAGIVVGLVDPWREYWPAAFQEHRRRWTPIVAGASAMVIVSVLLAQSGPPADTPSISSYVFTAFGFTLEVAAWSYALRFLDTLRELRRD